MEEVDLNDQSATSLANSEIDLSADDVADEGPDPRIQVELEKLNTSTDTINKLEVDLDEARMLFRQLLADSTQRIDVLAKRLGKCVEQSRPYYEARIRAKQALAETQAAAVRYERAMSQHAAAREMVFLAEEGLMQKGCTFDHTWQEMLNHATSKVNDAEREKIESAAEHRRTSALYHEAETRVKSLQKELKRAIAKSRPYFELKAAINQQLEAQKQRVRQLEESVTGAKMTYAQALANLETISDEIHRTRQSQLDLGIRGVGVGAESPLPPLQAVDGGIPLSGNPLHYAGSSLDSDTQDDYKTLPGKLGSVAAPILSSVMTPEAARSLLARTPSTSTSNMPTESLSTTVSTLPKMTDISSTVCTTACDVAPNSVVVDAEDVVVEEVDGATACTDLSGWQVIGLGSPALSSAQYLTVEDRDSTISDTESLASIEMLSDEAIAGLMLDEELAEASNAMGTPLNTPICDLPLPSTSTMCAWPTIVQNYINTSAEPQDTSTTQTVPASEEGSQESCTRVSESMMGLQLEDSFSPMTRQLNPPRSLPLSHDSSSEHSSPEDLTPGYVPLQNVCTPFSPEECIPYKSTSSSGPLRRSSSSSEEAREEPHRSSWVLENVPQMHDEDTTAKP
ncbi:serine-rich adhesin for platelets-like isoform X2 [Macrobrachium rosenbergii]|uniref:serine-rich adhesin for platelets-like isoform X2 n=1 Tax=Macrobrachium rosenbergii TaxID=79674 RepID=UPI0034D6A1EA